MIPSPLLALISCLVFLTCATCVYSIECYSCDNAMGEAGGSQIPKCSEKATVTCTSDVRKRGKDTGNEPKFVCHQQFEEDKKAKKPSKGFLMKCLDPSLISADKINTCVRSEGKTPMYDCYCNMDKCDGSKFHKTSGAATATFFMGSSSWTTLWLGMWIALASFLGVIFETVK